MNSITIVGNLGQDPESRSYTTADGEQTMAVLSVAVSRPPRGGQDQSPDWFDVKVFGRQAEPCLQYLARGRTVAVKGRMESSTVADPNDNTRSRKYWNLVADQVEFLGGGDQQQGGQQSSSPQAEPAAAAAGGSDLPF